jgi:hypothetical protein
MITTRLAWYSLLFCLVFAPKVVLANDHPYSSRLPLFEDSLKQITSQMFKGEDEQKKAANERFKLLLRKTLNETGAFEYPFDSLQGIARLTSPDERFRILNWNIPLNNGTHLYFGFIIVRDKEKSQFILHELIDKSDEIRNPESAVLSPDKWFGALYYKIIQTNHKKKTYYTLLGWDGNNAMIWKKVIDVITFRNDGVPVFGESALFDQGKYSKRRIIFQFKAEVVMTLRYEQNSNRIIFDHLAPEIANANEMFQYYVQTFSYDAYSFRKGKWQLLNDVDARNKRDKKDNLYNRPKPANTSTNNSEHKKEDLGSPQPKPKMR